MKTETMRVLTDPAPTPRTRSLRLMAEIIIHNAGRVLRNDEATNTAWAVLTVWIKYGLWEYSYLTPKSLSAVVNTIAEIVVYRQA